MFNSNMPSFPYLTIYIICTTYRKWSRYYWKHNHNNTPSAYNILYTPEWGPTLSKVSLLNESATFSGQVAAARDHEEIPLILPMSLRSLSASTLSLLSFLSCLPFLCYQNRLLFISPSLWVTWNTRVVTFPQNTLIQHTNEGAYISTGCTYQLRN